MDPVQPDTKLPVSSLLASSRRWEATAVPLGRNLRIVSWVALAASTLTLVVTLVHWPLVREADHQRAFFLLGWSQVTWLAGPSLLLLVTALFVSLVLVAGSALLTSGFRIGGPRLQVTCAAADALALAAVLPASPVLAVESLNAVGHRPTVGPSARRPDSTMRAWRRAEGRSMRSGGDAPPGMFAWRKHAHDVVCRPVDEQRRARSTPSS